MFAVVALFVIALRHNGDVGTKDEAGRRASVEALGFLDRDPSLAAQLALAGERLNPSRQSEMTMLAVASHGAGIERVIDPGGAPATAAIREKSTAVVATSDRRLEVWRPSSGKLLGQTRTVEPLTELADSWPGLMMAGATLKGAVVLIDISDPHKPRLREVGRILPPGERLLALSVEGRGTGVFVLGVKGTVVELDSNTGQVVSRWSLRETGLLGDEPGAMPHLLAASFEAEIFDTSEQLLVGTVSGAVVDVNLRNRRAHRVLAPGLAPGRITSIAREPYGRSFLTVGARRGIVRVEEPGSEPLVLRGQSVTAVASDEGGDIWRGNGEGVEVEREEEGADVETPVGEPVRELTKGAGGILAITRRGRVELLGQADAGIALEEAIATPAVAFDSSGHLLAAEGFDANHIEKLVAFEPGHKLDGRDIVFNPEVRGYRPDASWWPEAEEGTGLYVNAIDADSDFVVAAGQDPTDTAVVLVWDRKSGQPIQRLTMGIGGVEAGSPSIASDIVLLPSRHMVAAYSPLQQLVTVWSTDTWHRIAAVPVGNSGELSLSPDESSLLIAAESESTEEGDSGNAPSKLVFVDTDSWTVMRETRTPDTFRAAWSPDGSAIATLGKDGMLRFWSSDGSKETQQAVQLEGVPLALAWRPDGGAIAVSFEYTGIVLIDPSSGEVAAHLPGSTFASALAWNQDGSLLADVPSQPAEGEAEYRIPLAAQLWTLGPERLARRMCQLAGGPMDSATWRRLIDPNLSPRSLCPLKNAPEPSSTSDRVAVPILAYQSGHGVFVADEGGHTTQVGMVEKDPYPPVSFAWSGRGLAWSGSGQVGLLLDGSQRVSRWSCRCGGGVAWLGSSPSALESGGHALLRFVAGEPWPDRVTVKGSLGQEPRVLGSFHNTLVVAGYLGTPARGTPNRLFLVARNGVVTRVGGPIEGVLAEPVATAPNGDEVAFTSNRSGGACYFSTKVGILSLGPRGRPEVHFPPMPGTAWLKIIGSLQIDSARTVSGTFGQFECSHNESPSAMPEGERFELRDMTWIATSERGGDIQRVGKIIAIVSPEPEFGAGGDLTLQTPDGSVPVAESVTSMAARR